MRIGQVQSKQLLAVANDPARPVPDVTFETHYTLNVGGERVNLARHGTNHTPDNSYLRITMIRLRLLTCLAASLVAARLPAGNPAAD